MTATVQTIILPIPLGEPWYALLIRDVLWRLIRARREAGLTQSEVGHRLTPPVSHAAISDIEHGRIKLTLPYLFQLAAIYGKVPAYFLSLEQGCKALGEEEKDV